MKRAFATIAVWLCVGAFASAQSPNPIADNYRAYARAFELGRYAEAEAPAEAALSAAQAARDSRAGVLALNLALLRALHLGKFDAARAPAQKALDLGGTGIDPGQVRLVLALSELSNNFSRNAQALDAGIVAARAEQAPATGFLFDLAMAWGSYAVGANHGDSAERAFTHAVQLSEGESDNVSKSVALTGLGAAQVLERHWQAAADNLDQALTLILPLAPNSTGGPPTVADRALGQAYAWRYYVSIASDVSSSGCPLPLQTGPLNISTLRDAPICSGHINHTPLPHYPSDAVNARAEGVVMLWYDVNEHGELSNVAVVGAVPSALFPDAVMRVAPRWTYQWDAGATDCRRHAEGVMANIRFALSR